MKHCLLSQIIHSCGHVFIDSTYMMSKDEYIGTGWQRGIYLHLGG